MIGRKLFGKKGQSLVEFALILPIFILLVCAILDFGWLLGNQMLATYGCREGARYAAVNVTSPSFESNVKSKVFEAMPYYTHDGLVISATRTKPSSPRDGDVVVDVDYTFDLLTPFAVVLFGGQKYTAKAECVMKAE